MRKLLIIGSLLFLGTLVRLAEQERGLCSTQQHRDHALLPTIDLVLCAAPEWPSLLDLFGVPAPPAQDPLALQDHIAAIHRHLLIRCAAHARQQLHACARECVPRHALPRVMHRTNARRPSSEDDPPLSA